MTAVALLTLLVGLLDRQTALVTAITAKQPAEVAAILWQRFADDTRWIHDALARINSVLEGIIGKSPTGVWTTPPDQLLTQLQTVHQEMKAIMAKIDEAVAALTTVVTKVGASASAEIKAAVAAIAAAVAQGGTPQAVVDAVSAATASLTNTAAALDAETASLTPVPTPTPTPTPTPVPGP